MPDMLQIKGRFSVTWSLPDAFGLLHPGAFLFGGDRTTGRRLFACAAPEYRRQRPIFTGTIYIEERDENIDVLAC
jgi:hypothetical protein